MNTYVYELQSVVVCLVLTIEEYWETMFWTFDGLLVKAEISSTSLYNGGS